MRMAVVPSLNFKGTSGSSTPRFSARSVASPRSAASQTSSFALSARHMIKPEVGVAASISALGDLTPPWSGGRAAIGCTGKTDPVFPAVDGRVPYNVGRTRARAQLKLALNTEEETSRLRRLHEALDSNRFDRCLARELESATIQAQEISRKLECKVGDIKLPSPPTEGSAAASRKNLKKSKTRESVDESQPVPTENEAEVDAELAAKQSAAATRIQAIQRGHQGRDAAKAKKKDKEEAELVEKQTAAATRIQAIQRGNTGREAAKEKKKARESNDA